MDEKTIAAYNQLALKYDEETEDFWGRFPRTRNYLNFIAKKLQ